MVEFFLKGNFEETFLNEYIFHLYLSDVLVFFSLIVVKKKKAVLKLQCTKEGKNELFCFLFIYSSSSFVKAKLVSIVCFFRRIKKFILPGVSPKLASIFNFSPLLSYFSLKNVFHISTNGRMDFTDILIKKRLFSSHPPTFFSFMFSIDSWKIVNGKVEKINLKDQLKFEREMDGKNVQNFLQQTWLLDKMIRFFVSAPLLTTWCFLLIHGCLYFLTWFTFLFH